MFEDFGLFFLRFVLAMIFFAHGINKIKHRKKIADKMHTEGFMHFLGVAEFAGAVALLLGLFTTLASLGLAIVMISAIWMKTHKWKVPFTSQTTTGWEFDLLILAALIALIFLGPGLSSVDSLLLYA